MMIHNHQLPICPVDIWGLKHLFQSIKEYVQNEKEEAHDRGEEEVHNREEEEVHNRGEEAAMEEKKRPWQKNKKEGIPSWNQ